MIPYKESAEVYILGNNEEFIGKLDDSLVTINNVLSSKYVHGIKAEVEVR